MSVTTDRGDIDYDLAAANAIAEVLRAKRTHGPKNFNSIHEGYAVLLEEVDELWDEVKFNPKNGPFVGLEDNKREHRARMRKEAIQVAAMAIRFAAEVC